MPAFIRSRLPSGRVGRAIVAMAAGSAGVQLIGLLASPVTARVFSPAATGTGMVFAYLAAILGEVASLRYDMAMPLPKERSDRLDVLLLCLFIQVPLFLILTVAVLAGRGQIAKWMGDPAVADYLLLLPLGVLGYALVQMLVQWRSREQDFPRIVKARFHQSAGQVGYQLSAGALTAGSPWMLVTGTILGNLLCAAGLLREFSGEVLRRWRAVPLSQLWAVARQYRRFPLFNSWSVLANTFTSSIAVFALAALYSSEETGYYRMAQVLIAVPVAAISTAISSVYLSEAGRLVSEDPATLLRLYLKFTRRLACFAALIILGSLALPFIVPVLFGSRWAETGHYAMIMAWPSAATLVCVVANNIPLVGRNHWESLWTVLRIVAMLAGIYVCRETGLTARQTLAVISGILFACSGALIGLNVIALKAHLKQKTRKAAIQP